MKGNQLGFSYSPEKTLWIGPLIQQMCKDLLVLALKCSAQIAGSANFRGAHVLHPTGNDKPCVLGGQPEAWENDHHPQGTGFASTPRVFGYLLSSPHLCFLCCRDCLFVGCVCGRITSISHQYLEADSNHPVQEENPRTRQPSPPPSQRLSVTMVATQVAVESASCLLMEDTFFQMLSV